MYVLRIKLFVFAFAFLVSMLFAQSGGRTGIIEAPLELFKPPLAKLPENQELGENVFTEENITPEALEEAIPELSEKGDPNEKLFRGIDKCSAGLVKIALLQGAKNTSSKNGYPPLHYLMSKEGQCGKGRIHILRTLLATQPELFAQDINGFTPLHYAALQKDQESAIALVSAGASPEALSGKEYKGARVTPAELGGPSMKNVFEKTSAQ